MVTKGMIEVPVSDVDLIEKVKQIQVLKAELVELEKQYMEHQNSMQELMQQIEVRKRQIEVGIQGL